MRRQAVSQSGSAPRFSFICRIAPTRLEGLLTSGGFQKVRVERQTREGSFDSFHEYLEPIQAGIGSIPQIYLILPDAAQRAVRQEVRTRLAEFESGGRLPMSVEMLIGTGRA